MQKNILFMLLLLVGIFSCTPATETDSPAMEAEMAAPVSEKEKAINQAVLNAYDAISFEKGTTPDYEALKAIFTPEATFYNFRYDSLTYYGIDDFVTGFKGSIDAGDLLAFDEVELGGKTEYFGKIAHRISAYGSYIDGADEIGQKGVNSFQLLNIDGQWLVNSIIWDIEKEGQVIPDKYLNKE